MKPRSLFLFSAITIVSAATIGVACSGKQNAGYDQVDDAAARPDVTQPHDAGAPEGDSAPPPAHDSGPVTGGHCSAVQGSCDLVLQDCPSGEECAIAQTADGGVTTACSKVEASQHLAKGHSCCPSLDTNPCAGGLECIGDQTASCDGGTLPGHCSPHCCADAGDDSVCGQSDPEGIAGHCDLQVTVGDTPVFTACTYDEVCKPFGIRPCGPDKVCIIKDTSGTAGCYPTFNPDGGAASKEGQPCEAANACADGLACMGSGAVGTCEMLCLRPGSTPNFDAGALDGGPFHGGCNAGKTCQKQQITDMPSWLSVCE